MLGVDGLGPFHIRKDMMDQQNNETEEMDATNSIHHEAMSWYINQVKYDNKNRD